jgi:hypothetical protein
MRFAYRPYRADPTPADAAGIIFRPELKVRVWGATVDTREVPLWGLVDTGATECILPYEVADQVKPAWFPGEGGITGYAGEEHPVQYGGVYLQILIEKKRIRWSTVVAFSRKREETALWGRCGFLDHFRVTFDGPEKHFTIRLRGPAPAGFELNPLPRRRRRILKGGDLITPGDQNP